MERARVSSKGRVTIPKAVRRALDLKRGDSLVFELPEEGAAWVRVVKGGGPCRLYGALSPTRPFPGTEAVREEVGRDLGRRRSRPG